MQATQQVARARCPDCAHTEGLLVADTICPKCGGLLVIELRPVEFRRKDGSRRARILPPRLTAAEKRAQGLIPYPEDIPRPRTRGDCQGGERPCPWVSCRHHLYLDVTKRKNGVNGTLKINFPDIEPSEMTQSCALDIAERGGVTLDEVGKAMNLVRERVRQIETAALESSGIVFDDEDSD